ncbi:MAG: translocation/assembly module TamB domain-containing protein, partial [Bacteroidales bacterium]|nr:translocation/assembly module TamB domain-containing protein [Bacteroidales bacterium]
MENFEALRNFTTEVPLDIEMDQCLFDFRTLHYFSPKVDKLKLQLNLDGNLAGTVDNCSTKGFRVASGTKKTWLDMDFHLIGLPNARQTMATVDVRDSRITTEDLALIISQVAAPKFKPASVSRLAPDEVFKFTGSLNGLFQDFVAYGALNSGIGKANVDIICRSAAKKDYEIIGGMRATDFNLGELLQSKLFGKLDCNASISSYISKNKAKTQLTIEDVNIARIGINNYDYSSISATGTLDYDDFEGKVVCSDPNLKFMLQGILSLGKRDKGLYQFNMALGYADLHALNLDSRELSELQFQADANFARRDGTLLGKVDLRQVKGRNASGHFDIGEIKVHSSSDNSLYRINLNSSFINGRYAGSGNILNLIPDAKSALFSNRLENVLKDGGKSLQKYSGNYYSLDFKVLDVASIATFLEKDIHIQNGSSIEIDLDPQGNLKGAVRSPLMALGNNYIQNLAIDIDAPRDLPLSAVIKTETLQSGDIISHGGKIEVTADTNKADVILSMDEVENEISAGGKINFNLRFPERRPGEGLRFLADMGESRFDINSTIWNFYKGSIGYSKEGIAVSDIGIFSTSQTLKLDGIISKSESDTLHLQMHDFDAAIANVFVGEKLDMQGRITGSADLPAVLAKGGLLADFNVSDMSVAGSKMGNLKFSSLWDEELNHIKLLARSDLEGKRPLDVSGWLDPADNTIHGNARIDSLDMGFIDPFLHGILYGISGSISADLKVDGKLDDMKITSKECTLNDFGVTIDYTKVHYTFNGPFSVSEKGVTLNRVDASDDYGNTGIATGGVTWNNFKDIRMDTRVNVRNILALNTEEADNEVFYGKAFATGRVRLAGPFKDLTLYIDATTGDGTVINIPLSSKSSDQNPILVFINPERPKLTALDSLRFAKRQISSNRETESFFNVNLNINATTDAEIQLLIDKDVDNILKARGTGPINIVVDHHNFEIKGDYGVEQGSYKLALLGIVSRDFTINPGGSINFVGDIMKSE